MRCWPRRQWEWVRAKIVENWKKENPMQWDALTKETGGI